MYEASTVILATGVVMAKPKRWRRILR
jgi:hypothetical protein